MSELVLKSQRFRSEREADWKRLENLLALLESGRRRALSADDVIALPVLYRATLSSLSVARSISLDRNLVDYLESLCDPRLFLRLWQPYHFGRKARGLFPARLAVRGARALARNAGGGRTDDSWGPWSRSRSRSRRPPISISSCPTRSLGAAVPVPPLPNWRRHCSIPSTARPWASSRASSSPTMPRSPSWLSRSALPAACLPRF